MRRGRRSSQTLRGSRPWPAGLSLFKFLQVILKGFKQGGGLMNLGLPLTLIDTVVVVGCLTASSLPHHQEGPKPLRGAVWGHLEEASQCNVGQRQKLDLQLQKPLGIHGNRERDLDSPGVQPKNIEVLRASWMSSLTPRRLPVQVTCMDDLTLCV